MNQDSIMQYNFILGEDIVEDKSLFENHSTDILNIFEQLGSFDNNGILNEADYRDRIHDKFSLELMDINKFIKVNDLKEITNPRFFDNTGAPTKDGLLSNEIFGITKKSRSGIFAYIDLVEWFIDPSCYKVLQSLGKEYNNVIHGTNFYSINEDGMLIEDEEKGNTGIDWLKKNFDKIKFKRSDSKQRDMKIQYIERNYKSGKMFINKYPVIPAYYRDVNTSGKYTGVGEINRLYTNLLVATRSLRENNDYGLSMADSTCARVQDTLKLIYDWFCGNNNPMMRDKGTGMSKKFGVLRRSNLSKTTDYSSRLVMTAPELKVESAEDLMVDLDKSALPLAAAVADFYPFMMFHLRKLFENAYAGKNFYPIKLKNGEIFNAPIQNPMMYFNDDFLQKQLKYFLYSYDNRFVPIKIPLIENEIPSEFKNKKFYMQFDGQYYSDKKGKENIDPSLRRPFTWVDAIYIAAKEATNEKMMSFTRYPYDSYYNTIYTHIEISSTKETEHVIYKGKHYPFYPKIREEDIEAPSGNKFIDTIRICNLYLKGMGGDYDGDTGVAKGSFFKETNEELEKFVNKKVNFINMGCTNIRVSANEAVQAIYNLTKILNDDKKKITAPEF